MAAKFIASVRFSKFERPSNPPPPPPPPMTKHIAKWEAKP